jgi:hypothetical protein
MRFLRSNWPLILTAILLLAALALVMGKSLGRNDGNLIYALDDPYIHMAIAKNLVQSGVWGVTPHEFTSASSSVLWTLLLAITYFIFGVGESIPFWLNLLFTGLLLLFVNSLARKHGLASWAHFFLLMMVVFLSPVPTLIVEGLEHVLQILLVLAFVHYGIEALFEGDTLASRSMRLTLVLSALVALVRYEGAFVVFAVGLLFFARRRWRTGFSIGAAGAAPLVLFGVISVFGGAWFFPNSILLKAHMLGGIPDPASRNWLTDWLTRSVVLLFETPHLLVLVILSLVTLVVQLRKESIWSRSVAWNCVFVTVTFLHLQFAGTKWFYRYEAYLVALGLMALAVSIPEGLRSVALFGPWRRPVISLAAATTVLGGVLLYPLADRGHWALRLTPAATANSYQQQYQMALFIKRFYPDTTVAINDIGAISYLTDGHILDLYGLASMSVAEAKRSGRYDESVISKLVAEADARVAIIYDEWFQHAGLPEGWSRVGEWTVPQLISVDRATVVFYATQEDEVEPLAAHLREFSGQLPGEVKQAGLYLEDTEAGRATR